MVCDSPVSVGCVLAVVAGVSAAIINLHYFI